MISLMLFPETQWELKRSNDDSVAASDHAGRCGPGLSMEEGSERGIVLTNSTEDKENVDTLAKEFIEQFPLHIDEG